MIKIIGIFTVIISGWLIGYIMSVRLVKRKRVLSSYINLARNIGNEIKFSGADIKTVLSSCIKNDDILTLDGTKVVPVDTNCLTNAEKSQISAFFHLLGKSDVTGQYKLCEGYEHRFTDMYNTAEADCAQKCKIYRTLGLFGGLAVAIIFL